MFSIKAVTEHQSVGPKWSPAPRRPAWPGPAISPAPFSAVQRKPNCACGGDCPRCQEENAPQTKLRISKPGDAHEQEADRVAEQVMRMAAPEAEIAAKDGGVTMSRTSDESDIHRQAMFEEEAIDETATVDEEGIVPDETGMPKLRDGAAAPSRSASIHIPKAGGRPLDSGIRGFMEQRLGSNFDHVRLHTNHEAAASAEQIGAHAYTVGSDIYFNQGQYSPETHSGQKLLAHELTHVLQQTGQNRTVERQVQRTCTNTCSAGSCPQGKQSRVIRNDCGLNPEPVNPDNYISALNVSLSAKTVQVIWSGLIPGNTEVWPCSPHPTDTPLHSPDNPDVVGTKCSINHTNRHKDGMAWFTGFASEGLRIGFHDSQNVGAGCQSHGCVRVCCDKAEIINKNTWGGRTTITVT